MLGPSKYSFWWTPKPVTGRRSTRAQKGTPTDPYRNVMYDKRVIRGSNYGVTTILTELDPLDKAAETRRRNVLRKKILARNQRNVIGTPPPVFGRRHEILQTDKYLEELLEHPPTRSVDSQTDLFLELPTTPPYVVSKIGIDVGTSIDHDDLLEETEKANDEVDEPFIENFVEACILETTYEVENEAQENSEKLLEQQVAKVLPNVMEKFELEADETQREQLITTLCPRISDQDAEEVAEIVDSREILSVIIEEIIKQRGETYAVESETSSEIANQSEERLDEN